MDRKIAKNKQRADEESAAKTVTIEQQLMVRLLLFFILVSVLVV